MAKDIKAIFKKYLEDNSIKDSDKLTLDQWYELEEAAHEANKLSGGDSDSGDRKKWMEINGGYGRQFSCLMYEVESNIKQLGGKILAERERERESKISPNAKYVSKGNVKKLLKMVQMTF